MSNEEFSGLDSQESASKDRFPALRFDVEAYRADLKGANLTEAQQQAFLTSLFQIMPAFVDLGFDLRPGQQACGQIDKRTGPNGRTDADTGGAEHISLTGLFNDTMDRE